MMPAYHNCNDFSKGKLLLSISSDVARAQNPAITIDSLGQFAESYLGTLGRSYHFGFGVACLSLIVSMLIFWGFRKYYRQADVTEKQKAASTELKSQVVELTPDRQRGLVLWGWSFLWFFSSGWIFYSRR
jgi:hypothetical protein